MHRACSRSCSKTSARWPIWLLLAAWFCANCPPHLTFDLSVWVKNGQHLSHQERLQAEVTALLAGRSSRLAALIVKAAPVLPPAAPIPAKQVLRKLELYALETGAAAPLSAQTVEYPRLVQTERDHVRAKPLLTPPRRVALV